MSRRHPCQTTSKGSSTKLGQMILHINSVTVLELATISHLLLFSVTLLFHAKLVLF